MLRRTLEVHNKKIESTIFFRIQKYRAILMSFRLVIVIHLFDQKPKHTNNCFYDLVDALFMSFEDAASVGHHAIVIFALQICWFLCPITTQMHCYRLSRRELNTRVQPTNEYNIFSLRPKERENNAAQHNQNEWQKKAFLINFVRSFYSTDAHSTTIADDDDFFLYVVILFQFSISCGVFHLLSRCTDVSGWENVERDENSGINAIKLNYNWEDGMVGVSKAIVQWFFCHVNHCHLWRKNKKIHELL